MPNIAICSEEVWRKHQFLDISGHFVSYILIVLERIFKLRTLYTFAATRPLRALYFDGFSAAKVEGMLDLQNVLVYGKADGAEPFEDFERGKLLCEWGKRFGIEGFVREEATFELYVSLVLPYIVTDKISYAQCVV